MPIAMIDVGRYLWVTYGSPYSSCQSERDGWDAISVLINIDTLEKSCVAIA